MRFSQKLLVLSLLAAASVGMTASPLFASATALEQPAGESGGKYENESFRNISVTKTGAGQYTVKGEARVFEAAFSWTLEDGHNILAEGHGMADQGAPAWGHFRFDVNYEQASQPNLTLILFVHSAKDGSVQQELIVPLQAPEDRIRYSANENK